MERFEGCEFTEEDKKREEFKKKVRDGLNKASDIGKEVVDFAVKNPLLSAAVITGGTSIFRQANINHRRKQESEESKRHVYDRELGFGYDMKRKPSARQIKEIARRKASGESITRILQSMHLI